MNIHLFGVSNSTGQAFINLIKKSYPFTKIIIFSRDQKSNYADLDDVSSYEPSNNDNYVLVSFAPVWKISNFLKNLFKNNFSKFEKIKGLIICSSSSVLTKRFSYNNFDKELALKLKNSEEYHSSTLSIPIYHSLKNKDQNFIINVIKKFFSIVKISK